MTHETSPYLQAETLDTLLDGVRHEQALFQRLLWAERYVTTRRIDRIFVTKRRRARQLIVTPLTRGENLYEVYGHCVVAYVYACLWLFILPPGADDVYNITFIQSADGHSHLDGGTLSVWFVDN